MFVFLSWWGLPIDSYCFILFTIKIWEDFNQILILLRNATFLSSTSVFNIDDNGKKCFLSSKSAYKNMRPSLKIFWFAVTAIFFKKRVGR